MPNAILRGIRFVILVLGGYHHVALENAALRQQLAVFKRDLKRPRLRRRDRLFWTGLRTIWKNWKSVLVIVRPETVISWQRKRFKRYWVWLNVIVEQTALSSIQTGMSKPLRPTSL